MPHFNADSSSPYKYSPFKAATQKSRSRSLSRNFLGLFLIIFVLFSLNIISYADETIQAENNAYRHNNKGLLYLEDKYYFGAIKEFQIAIDLNPNSQASSVFYYNLGNTYETIGYYSTPYFEKAVSLNPLYFDYYLKLAENYKSSGIAETKLLKYQSDFSSPFNRILLGLLYIQTGETSTGITVLDDFCGEEENLIITKGIKDYIEKISSDSE